MAPASTTAPAAQQDLAKGDSPKHLECIEVQVEDEEQGTPTQSISRRISTASIGTDATHRPAARFCRNVQRVSRALLRPFKPLDLWIQTRMRRSRFHGWRMGVLIGTCSSAFVLCCNIIAVAVTIATAPKEQSRIVIILPELGDPFSLWDTTAAKNRGRLVDIMSGNAASVSRWSTVIHLVINVFSTILLGASNYTAQVLCSPTRDDLDAAHRKGTWLDIGLLSLRNFRYLPRGRVALGLLLSISSIPLHLFYNAAVFEVRSDISMYRIYAFDAKSDIFAALNSSSKVEAFPGNGWWKVYETDVETYAPNPIGYGDLYLAIDGFIFDPEDKSAPNSTSVVMSDYLPSMTVRASSLTSNASDPWINFGFDKYTSPENIAWPRKAHVTQSFATKFQVQSRIKVSRDFMIVVIFFDFLKVVIMLWVLVTDRSDYLVTFGDAVASYLQTPDPTTEGACMLDKAGHLFTLGERTDLAPNVDNHGDFHRRLNGIWLPRRVRYSMLLPEDRQKIFVILLIFAIGAIATVPAMLPSKESWEYDYMSILPNTQSRDILYIAWLANSPQVLLSFCYLAFNNICTCIASTEEWNQLAHQRKSLRVSRPLGGQRETYFLQLPYRYAVPLMLVSILLHWLLSQALFLKRSDTYNGDGVTFESRSWCQYSSLYVIVLLIVALALLIILACVGYRRMQVRLPPAASCSLVISAACHPPKTDVDAHLKKVKWGAIRGLDPQGVGHCCLTGLPVTKPESGARYR